MTTFGILPCVYALLTNKQQATYTTVLNEIKNIEARLDRSSVMIDFEIAVMNSIITVFPRAEIKGCFVHLCQNVYRKVQALGLQQIYQSDNQLCNSG